MIPGMPPIGFMRGNHTFKLFPTCADAVKEISEGIQWDEARLYEMAFVGHGHDAKHLHIDMHEPADSFLARAETFFARYAMHAERMMDAYGAKLAAGSPSPTP